MTRINYDQLNQIEYVDQALVWCVVCLEHANHHPDNFYLSDNASVRAESKDLVEWYVIQDDEGNGQFIFSGLLPMVNPSPLLEQRSILQCIKSYTPYTLADEQITFPDRGRGMRLPEIPFIIDSMEKLLVWLVQIVESVHRYMDLINKMILYKYVLGPDQELPEYIGNSGVIQPMIAPELQSQLNNLSGAGDTSANSIIALYNNPASKDDLYPGWYGAALDHNFSHSSGGTDGLDGDPRPVDPGTGFAARIDTLPTCKEQDPSVTAFSKDGVLNFSDKK